jgi:hypothetical protein
MKNEIQILKVIYKNNSLLAARISQILFTPVFQKFGPLHKFCGILSVEPTFCFTSCLEL